MIKVSREKKNTADRSECYEKEIPEWRPAVKRGDKLKKNLKVTFRIRMTSNRGHYFWKVTPNLPTYRSNPADLCTKIFNGVYCISTLRFTIRSTLRFTIWFNNKVHNKVHIKAHNKVHNNVHH